MFARHMLSFSTAAALVCVLLLALPSAALADPAGRVALVIGNSDYRAAPLKNPANDAEDVAKKLGQLGFSVIHLKDVRFKPMVEAFQDFARRAPKHEVRLLYYAGHGLQFRDSNYLIPVDADLKEQGEIARQTFLFDGLVEKLAQIKGGVNIYILDACRHNPFGSIVAFGKDGREIRLRGNAANSGPVVGLAPPKQAIAGTFIAFSTTPGQIAHDNPAGRNSVYAKHLLRHLDAPGVAIGDLFMRVRAGVIEETQSQQVPWESTSLVEKFCFKVGTGGVCE